MPIDERDETAAERSWRKVFLAIQEFENERQQERRLRREAADAVTTES